MRTDQAQELVKATFYLRSEDVVLLEEIRLERLKRGQRIDKSALVREALNLLKQAKGGEYRTPAKIED